MDLLRHLCQDLHHESDQFEEAADLDEVEAEIRAQIERFKSFGIEPSHLDNHMGSLYGIETGRFELVQMTIELAGQYGLPFRFPMQFTDAQFTNDMLAIHVPKEMIEQFIGGMTQLGQSVGVAMPDFLLPSHWNGPQSESFENYREYIYEFYRTFEPGVTETYIHPALPTDDLKGSTGAWERRVWEYELFKDPKTRQHIESLGIKLINYRDLKKMRGF